jgi:hypothetical protein
MGGFQKKKVLQVDTMLSGSGFLRILKDKSADLIPE